VPIVIGSNITFGNGINIGTVVQVIVTNIVEEDGASLILTEAGDTIIEEN